MVDIFLLNHSDSNSRQGACRYSVDSNPAASKVFVFSGRIIIASVHHEKNWIPMRVYELCGFYPVCPNHNIFTPV